MKIKLHESDETSVYNADIQDMRAFPDYVMVRTYSMTGYKVFKRNGVVDEHGIPSYNEIVVELATHDWGT